MIYQNFVSYYPSLQLPGESYANDRHTSIYRSACSLIDPLLPGQGVVVTGQYDHTRLVVANPTAANFAIATNYVGIVANSSSARDDYSNRTLIGSSISTSNNVIPAGEHVRLKLEGTIYVIVEKTILTTNRVYMRVANGTAALNGIGYFSDTASADHVLIPNARWYGTDNATFLATKDAAITPALERQRIGMSKGFGIAPLSIRFADGLSA
jgi:hypothetical protein